MIIIEQKEEDGATKVGKLNLVDLAGSEKIGKTGATGQTLEEVCLSLALLSPFPSLSRPPPSSSLTFEKKFHP